MAFSDHDEDKIQEVLVSFIDEHLGNDACPSNIIKCSLNWNKLTLLDEFLYANLKERLTAEFLFLNKGLTPNIVV